MTIPAIAPGGMWTGRTAGAAAVVGVADAVAADVTDVCKMYPCSERGVQQDIWTGRTCAIAPTMHARNTKDAVESWIIALIYEGGV